MVYDDLDQQNFFGEIRQKIVSEEISRMPTDPVCYAYVDEDSAQFRTTFKDKEYFFCTNYCKKQFLEDPKKFAQRNTDISIEPGGASC